MSYFSLPPSPSKEKTTNTKTIFQYLEIPTYGKRWSQNIRNLVLHYLLLYLQVGSLGSVQLRNVFFICLLIYFICLNKQYYNRHTKEMLRLVLHTLLRFSYTASQICSRKKSVRQSHKTYFRTHKYLMTNRSFQRA